MPPQKKKPRSKYDELGLFFNLNAGNWVDSFDTASVLGIGFLCDSICLSLLQLHSKAYAYACAAELGLFVSATQALREEAKQANFEQLRVQRLSLQLKLATKRI